MGRSLPGISHAERRDVATALDFLSIGLEPQSLLCNAAVAAAATVVNDGLAHAGLPIIDVSRRDAGQEYYSAEVYVPLAAAQVPDSLRQDGACWNPQTECVGIGPRLVLEPGALAQEVEHTRSRDHPSSDAAKVLLCGRDTLRVVEEARAIAVLMVVRTLGTRHGTDSLSTIRIMARRYREELSEAFRCVQEALFEDSRRTGRRSTSTSECSRCLEGCASILVSARDPPTRAYPPSIASCISFPPASVSSSPNPRLLIRDLCLHLQRLGTVPDVLWQDVRARVVVTWGIIVAPRAGRRHSVSRTLKEAAGPVFHMLVATTGFRSGGRHRHAQRRACSGSPSAPALP